ASVGKGSGSEAPPAVPSMLKRRTRPVGWSSPKKPICIRSPPYGVSLCSSVLLDAGTPHSVSPSSFKRRISTQRSPLERGEWDDKNAGEWAEQKRQNLSPCGSSNFEKRLISIRRPSCS